MNVNETAGRSVKRSLLISSTFILLLWLVFALTATLLPELRLAGVHPGSAQGLAGILTMPLLHSSAAHLASNSMPLLVMGSAVHYLYPSCLKALTAMAWLGGGLLAWLAGDQGSVHIGASGLNYGLVTFLFFSGVIRRKSGPIALALLVSFVYGYMVNGLFPQPEVSWQGHLGGSLGGFAAAVLFRSRDRPPVRLWVDEPHELDVERPFFEPGEDNRFQ